MSSEMNKCQQCGVFVPAEKAFCPNCSEPMEPEERPNRAHSFSPEMLSTIRDDPEKYRDILMQAGKMKKESASAIQQPQQQQQQQQPPPPVAPPPPSPNPLVMPPTAPPPVMNYNAAPAYAFPERKSSKGPLLLIISAILLIGVVFVLLIVFKVI